MVSCFRAHVFFYIITIFYIITWGYSAECRSCRGRPHGVVLPRTNAGKSNMK